MDMAAVEEGETLESWLNKATDPNNPVERWDCIQGFYEQVNKELEGPQIAVRLLAHKIQSPQEKEALQAITVLEACMNNCGKRFHSEAGKFRFLNELIKVLSPKYLGMWSTAEVKLKVTEVLYSWTQWLKDEVKIQEAYHMLKKQGIIKKDPKLPENMVIPPPSPRAVGSVFDDEDKSKLLAKLLKSRHPDDLQAANRLIKNTIKEEQEKMEKESKRITTMEEVENNTKRLKELLENHRSSESSEGQLEEMRNLYERCDKLRPTLFRLASDTVDNDEALAEILQANDKLTSVINLFQEMVETKDVNGNSRSDYSKSKVPASPKEIKSYHLIDLSALDSTTDSTTPSRVPHSSSLSLLDEELVSLGLNDPSLTETQETLRKHSDELIQLWREKSPGVPGPNARFTGRVEESRGVSVPTARGYGDSDSSQGFHILSAQQSWPVLQPRSASSDLQQPASVTGSPSKSSSPANDKSLSDLFVSLESIKPSGIAPIIAYDKNGIRVMLHFAKDCPMGRADVAVMVISMLSTSPIPVRDVVFQVAVPKSMRVKLQPATGSDLPAYNPVVPPAVISQILLLSNPLRDKVRIRYKLTFIHGEQKTSELGEIENFPDMSSWTSL
ncbi:ADP-ribosylation factor-binding protein GGA3-like [Megalops cyprinoides]|uniref:ADP-ribosylation factor-binding protein GGA3-like n=1 Tax=Megalops cyprinoides TaxID=118141 RepID=UPI0018644E77|nr:ADP-ribosylation factor-binding protein GGA3-like [Megalops cyprinoides]